VAVPGNAAQVAGRPTTNMYRDPGDIAGQPAAATPQVTSWMGTIGHVAPGEGTMDTDLETTAEEASEPYG
jgi:hypothetical protein